MLVSDKHGSFTMQNLSGEKQERLASDAKIADDAVAKRQKATETKDEATRVRAEAVAGFEACKHACVCTSQPCAWAKWKCCPVCGPKKGECKV